MRRLRHYGSLGKSSKRPTIVALHVARLETPGDDLKSGIRLDDIRTRSQARHGLHVPRPSLLLPVPPPLRSSPSTARNPEVHAQSPLGAIEPLGRDTDNSDVAAAQFDDAANHCRVCTEGLGPQVMTEDGHER